MTIIATQLPNIQASFVRARYIATSSNLPRNAERHIFEINISRRYTSRPNHADSWRATVSFQRFTQIRIRNQPFMICLPMSRRTLSWRGGRQPCYGQVVDNRLRDSARVQRTVRAPSDCNAQRKQLSLTGTSKRGLGRAGDVNSPLDCRTSPRVAPLVQASRSFELRPINARERLSWPGHGATEQPSRITLDAKVASHGSGPTICWVRPQKKTKVLWDDKRTWRGVSTAVRQATYFNGGG